MALYEAVMEYGKQRKDGENKKEIYKMILKLDRKTPNYILEKETKMKKLRMEAIKRAVKYEQKARQSEKKIIIECRRNREKERKYKRK